MAIPNTLIEHDVPPVFATSNLDVWLTMQDEHRMVMMLVWTAEHGVIRLDAGNVFSKVKQEQDESKRVLYPYWLLCEVVGADVVAAMQDAGYVYCDVDGNMRTTKIAEANWKWWRLFINPPDDARTNYPMSLTDAHREALRIVRDGGLLFRNRCAVIADDIWRDLRIWRLVQLSNANDPEVTLTRAGERCAR